MEGARWLLAARIALARPEVHARTTDAPWLPLPPGRPGPPADRGGVPAALLLYLCRHRDIPRAPARPGDGARESKAFLALRVYKHGSRPALPRPAPFWHLWPCSCAAALAYCWAAFHSTLAALANWRAGTCPVGLPELAV